MERLRNLNWTRLSWVVAIEVAILQWLATWWTPGGNDWYLFYVRQAGGCATCGYAPPYVSWLLAPIGLIQVEYSWPAITAVTLVATLWLCRYLGTNPLVVVAAFPFFGEVWLGQIDVFVMVGLVLIVQAARPELRGLGIILALTKPQLGVIPVVMMVLLEHRRDLVRVLWPPLVFGLLTLIVFGPTWPLAWVERAMQLPTHTWRLDPGLNLWIVGLPWLALPWLWRERRERMQTALLASAVALPFFSSYSFVTFWIFGMPAWAVPASYSWLIAYPWLGEAAVQLIYWIPWALLVLQLLRHPTVQAWRRRWRAPSAGPAEHLVDHPSHPSEPARAG